MTDDDEFVEYHEAVLDFARTCGVTVHKMPYRITALRQAAIENADDQRYAYAERSGEHFREYDSDPPDDVVDRQIVNLLRHRYSNYDDLLSELRKFDPEDIELANPDVDEDAYMEQSDYLWDAYREAYGIIRQRVHDALRKAYPRLQALRNVIEDEDEDEDEELRP